MKISGDPIEYSRSLPKTVRAVLFYGPNQEVRSEAVAHVRKRFLGEGAGDDLAYVVMTPERLKNEPTALADEMSSFGFFASQKLLHIKDGDDTVMRAAQAALDSPDAGHLLVIEADALTPRSALRIWAEKAPDVAAVPCYMLEGNALVQFVHKMFQQENLRITPDGCALLIARLGGDMAGLKNRIAQLHLYAGMDADTITDKHVEALLVDQAEQEMDAVVQAVAGRNAVALDHGLPGLYEAGTSLVAVLRSLQYYFYRLRTVQAALAAGEAPDKAFTLLRPPLFFKMKAAFSKHLRDWPLVQIDQALQEFMALEAACKKTGTPELILVQHRLTRLCMMKPKA